MTEPTAGPGDETPEGATTPPDTAAATDDGAANSAGTDSAAKPVFTKEPQPELPLELRKQKAGLNRNRIGIWIVVGGFGLYMIITGIVGILTKAR